MYATGLVSVRELGNGDVWWWVIAQNKSPGTAVPGLSFYINQRLGLAGAAADRRAAEAYGASAAGFQTLLHAVAAGLDHFAAGFVAAEASDAYAVFGVLALADAAAEIALANGHTVHCATATTHLVAKHLAEVLQRAASDLVVALAVDLHAVFALLDLEGASRGDAPIGHRLRGGSRHAGILHHGSVHHHRTTHNKILF